MEKMFLDVFPNLIVDEQIQELVDVIVVTKVAMNSSRDLLRVYITSKTWIHKKHILALQSAIKEQFFANVKLQVKIIEKFELSSQYTPENFLEAYRSSIALELKEYSILEYNIFNTASISFPEEKVMEMTTTLGALAEGVSEELIRVLEKIFCERSGFSLKIHMVYEEARESVYHKNSELRVAQEAKHLLSMSAVGRGEGSEEDYENGDGGDGNQGEGAAEEVAGAGSGNAVSESGLVGADSMNGAGKDASGNAAENNAVSGAAKNSKDAGSDGKNQKTDKKKGGYGGRGNGGNNWNSRRYEMRKSDNPDVLYGKDFDDDAIAIETIIGEIGEVTIRGQIISTDSREIRNEKTILIFAITDFTDTIVVKMFVRNEQVPEMSFIKKGAFIRLKGITTIDRFDGDLTIGSVVGIKKSGDFRSQRMDNSPEKRVELHCHTKMSDMDGVSDATSIIKRAYEWGQKAIAITDHGVVQAFPEANHVYGGAIPKDADFKVIYGVEGYLVDDLKGIVENSKHQTLDETYVVFDLETTGFSPNTNQIIEIGAVKVEQGKIVDRFSTFVNPKVPIPFRIENLTSITDDMVSGAPAIEEILPQFMEFIKGCVLVAHNAVFDVSFMAKNCERQGISFDYTSVDTIGMARFLLPNISKYKLNNVAKALNVSLQNHHRAVDDAACTAEIFLKFVNMCKEREIETLDRLNEVSAASVENIRKMRSHHAIILATNETGRINLYTLISQSHLTYYNRQPKIPKSLFMKYRDGLIIGSACEAGELYQAILDGRSDEEIARLVRFYDYLEIQPLGNNAFMLRKEGGPVTSEEDLKDINRKIVKLGEQFKKPVVATCDVHFLNPEDEVYRRIIMKGKGFDDADDQAPLYLRTTEEMMEEFAYLGYEKAREVVITNTNKISDMCEKICPIHPDKFPPVIENSDQDLRNICYTRAREIYGENLPSIVEARLEKELNSIISNGYAVMYIIAQKLVWKSNEDGYLVGSRGSVGSSLAATMSGITEVNPLSPHYICEECHYSDFDSEEVKAYSGRSGCDMPDKICPVCGAKLKKDGFDIPFETFLGFDGDKEPDIDLNFSGDYQAKAHKYTEVIFGEGQTFKAGTIGTLADKTAFGYVKKYYEEKGIHKRNCEIDRIVQGCTGIRRSTGQHPGGIIVLPLGEDINMFTPVQHPANDMTSDIITTHFDYHSIDGNLLKLDILGHDDPTMIRMLEDLTGIDAKQIPLDSKEVMSLFADTSALKISPDDIGGCKLGCLGIPEFGTDFAMQMLIDTKPQAFSDLIRIAGLSHGTDVWLGNAQTLIDEGKATISTAICTRDDIMIYLIQMGVDAALSFKIMEFVRKGRGLQPGWEEVMLEHNVPDWYIWSCKKIKYMFPKAHAAAYVMMAWRIAYCKIFYPQAYYAAYFSIRANAFSYELMCLGKERLEFHMKQIKDKGDSAANKEEDQYKDMKIVQEMYARGFEFLPLDIYKAKAHRFQVIDGKIMPSLDSVEGLGDKAADMVEAEAKKGLFLSKDDFRTRTKVSKGAIDLMADLGLFGDIPESNQISLFDFQ